MLCYLSCDLFFKGETAKCTELPIVFCVLYLLRCADSLMELRKESIMKKIRLIALFLVLSLIFPFLPPIAYAVDTPAFELGDIHVSGDNAFCIYRSNDYTYCAHINTSSTSGSFAINYTNNPDVIYEYTFATDLANMAVDSTGFWNAVLSECFSSSAQWSERSLSGSISVSTPSDGVAQPYAVDPYGTQLTQKLQNIVGVAPYTGSIVATAYKGSLIFHVYQDLTYYASVANLFQLAQSMSVASFITGVLAVTLDWGDFDTSTLLSILSLGFAAGGMTIGAGMTVKVYSVSAKWERYVKRRDSSSWLTEAKQYTLSCYAYVNPNTGFCEIDTGSFSEAYAPSQAQYNDTAALLEEGYQYYLTLQ